MKGARLDGFYLVLLGGAVFLILGLLLEVGSTHPVSDFRFVYNGARCLFQHVDPYNQEDFVRTYVADGGDLGKSFFHSQYMDMAHHMYLPTSSIIAPLALMPWRAALALWTILIACSFMLASFLMWEQGAERAPVLSGLLIGLILGGSELLIVIGNAAGIVISLCVIAVWCFVKERFVIAGVLCLAISLLLKPHDAGLVWLYFLLAGGVLRKRAIQTLIATVVVGLPMVIWVTLVAPNWFSELRANLAILSAHGHLNDPGPASMAGHGTAMIIDLQTVFSMFRDDPHIYNLASYLVCGLLLAIWAVITLRTRSSPDKAWFALAAISALSMLPVYHRLGDAKILLLTIPACAILWAQGGVIKWLALAVNAAAVLLTGDLQWAIFLGFLRRLPPTTSWWGGHLRVAVQVFPVPLILLGVSVFYLWAYARCASGETTNKVGNGEVAL